MPASLMRPGESVEDGAAVGPRPGKRSKTSGDGEAGAREISRHARAIYPYKAPKATAGVWPSYQVRWERERMLSRAPHCRDFSPPHATSARHRIALLSRAFSLQQEGDRFFIVRESSNPDYYDAEKKGDGDAVKRVLKSNVEFEGSAGRAAAPGQPDGAWDRRAVESGAVGVGIPTSRFPALGGAGPEGQQTPFDDLLRETPQLLSGRPWIHQGAAAFLRPCTARGEGSWGDESSPCEGARAAGPAGNADADAAAAAEEESLQLAIALSMSSSAQSDAGHVVGPRGAAAGERFSGAAESPAEWRPGDGPAGPRKGGTSRGRVPPVEEQGMVNIRERRALLIGNSKYAHEAWRAGVTRCEKDATALAHQLGCNSLGDYRFRAETELNATKERMENRIRDWVKGLPKRCVALIGFAGHGFEEKGINYFVPVDAPWMGEEEVQYKCVSFDWIMAILLHHLDGESLIIVLLDCCREETSRGLRGFGGKAKRGLGKVDLSSKDSAAVFVGYAAAPGRVAEEESVGR